MKFEKTSKKKECNAIFVTPIKPRYLLRYDLIINIFIIEYLYRYYLFVS